jgi:transcriptional regulator with XRE-family HTH domain
MSSAQSKPLGTRERIGRNLKMWRIRRGLSQENLSASAEISQTFFSQVETGRRNVSVDVLDRLAHVLQIDISELFAC